MAKFFFPLVLLLILHSAIPSLQKMSPVDLAALSAIKDSLIDIKHNNFFSTWDFTAPDPCSSFSGIACSSLNRVISLTLGTGLSGSPGLAGSLSPSIANLTELTQLILFSGLVTGPIPPQIGQLKNLRVISLTKNRLTGPIPTTFSSLPNLHTLDLSFNELTGSISPGLTGLTQLKVLILASNRLSGDLPDVVSTELLHLDLKINKLTGKLPLSLPSTIRYLSLSENTMWGQINGLQSLSELVFLDLSMNQFSGPIPPSLFDPRLSLMFLQRNNLSGGVPPRTSDPTASYGEGSIVDLSHNFLTGELSGVLAGVETLFLNNNRLMGTIPQDYIDSVYSGTTKTLYLQHNYMSRFPLKPGRELPDTASICLVYNCMVPPVGLTTCPASAGDQLSRPAPQCSGVFEILNSSIP
ncbi:probable leucine-rich repeat receptor-like protein kinase At1g35710 [Tripterygium wilfordii]|uniref:probable leucine-rich repeat receptor-like protein kinase At1g35710 n=1 Tax=Tripterygium wilfordii TaxID=458696 RepID=UPI0018F801E1|nr:probable leucine-rich repeat receptor-like protein kinase At1g35710 [Tripterygium wilfordii]